jgi:hypothetical protein
MATLWILTADANQARVYTYLDGQPELLLVRVYESPAGRVMDERCPRGVGEPPAEYWSDRFARDLGELLEVSAMGQAYDHLMIAAPEHFLAKILDAVGPMTHERLLCALPKNVMDFGPHDLDEYLGSTLRLAAKETIAPAAEPAMICASAD